MSSSRLKFFLIPLDGLEEGEKLANDFLARYRIVSVRTRYVTKNDENCLLVCVEYVVSGNEDLTKRERALSGKKNAVDYKDVLNAEDFRVFCALRKARNQLATERAVPPYLCGSNEHLAEMARKRPRTHSELKSIKGFGDGHIEKYGDIYLKTLEEFVDRSGAEEESTTDDDAEDFLESETIDS